MTSVLRDKRKEAVEINRQTGIA